MEIREQALTEISRDLHDNFGQIASLIKINLNMMAPPQQKGDRLRVEESKKLLTQLITDMRSLSSSLNGNNLKEKGLMAMIERDVKRVKRSGFIEINLLHRPDHLSLKAETSIFTYRMFQEILNNILKHSQATNASVNVYSEGGKLTLHVSDNGVGMDPASENEGNGLRNIRERCKIIGASLSLDSSTDKGTFIEIEIPT